MSKKISGAEYPLAKIFSSDFEYVIPSYQRPYAWTEDEASELINDLFDFYDNEPEEGYFLGSIVLIKEEDRPKSEVIDGQQRLTTLTILLAALASTLQGTDRETLLKYIREPGNKFEGLEAKPRLSLRDRDKDFFGRYVQGLHFEELSQLNESGIGNESQKNLRKNALLMRDRLSRRFDNPEIMKGFVQFLLQRCFLVAVSTPNEQSAFRVFSVMNSRGLDLQPTDIIKADVIGKIESEPERDSYSERWEEIEVTLGRSRFNDLFAYIRMIYAKEKARRALLEEFRSHVINRGFSPQSLVAELLEPYAEALSTALNADYASPTNAQNINNYLKWLNRIDNSDWIPPAIKFLAAHKNEPEYLAWFFRKLERLAAYLHICSKNVNQRIERYSKLISELEDPHNIAHPITSIELTPPEKAEMLREMNGDVYYLAARRRNYLILRLDSFLADGAATYDHNILTIEHVLPQTIYEDSEWRIDWPDEEIQQQWTHRLANLVPLNFRRNAQASNFPFTRKKDSYFTGKKQVSSFALTSQVLNAPNWTPDFLQERQIELLDVLSENWELQ
ncbi:DUF262 domain-containing protein [Hahella sp. KA22]|uniref:DUF262 domain-containing protein n=1 Tax=Hahella sp. KA22 TaxID=1628392 RepID=UPI000FDDFC75|nr:DUF262 domain-containing protein [Hahella sp. KA22]AZZ92137.1 DUF262 domain-containing protein [Hahella sp. KA22]QAY55508.1 DUF262 domain-containing protein [Hahella sp. KA22]